MKMVERLVYVHTGSRIRNHDHMNKKKKHCLYALIYSICRSSLTLEVPVYLLLRLYALEILWENMVLDYSRFSMATAWLTMPQSELI